MGIFFLKIILIALWLFIGYTIIRAFKSMAPWVPIYRKDMERMIDFIDLKPGQTFIDLGSGDGRLCVALSKATQGKIIGVELAWPLYVICKIRQWINDLPNLNFFFGDLFGYDISHADVIYVYGLPKSLKCRLNKKLLTEAKPGAKIISYCFEIPDLDLEITNQNNSSEVPIYRYAKN